MIDERVVPTGDNVTNLQKHIARYNLSLIDAKGKDVLDLACGTGYGSFLLNMVAKSVEGVDISRDAIDYAKKYFKSKNLTFKQSDILDYDHSQVDLIVSFETVEHIEDLNRLEDKFSTLLKSGGKLIYSVPLYENYHNPYHFHKFDLLKGLSLFRSFKDDRFAIQDGLFFSMNDQKKPFTYLIVSKIKN